VDIHILPLAVTMVAGPQEMTAIVFVTHPAAVRVSAAFLTGAAVAVLAGTTIMYLLAGTLHLGLPSDKGSTGAIIQYVLALIGVYVIAFIIDALAPTFGGRKDFNSAFKVAAYAPTAAWVAGVFALLPILSVLTVPVLYSLYLLYIGLPMLMRTPPERAIGYVIAVIVCAVIVWVLIFTLPLMLLGMRVM